MSKENKKEDNLVEIPLARIKRIMKTDQDVKLISQEALVLVSKSTELFLQHLAKETLKQTQNENRKTIQYKDMSNTVKELDCFDFLQEVIPDKTQPKK